MEDIMEVIHVKKKGKMLDTLGGFHIHKETKASNLINDKITVRENAIFENHSTRRPLQGKHSSTATEQLRITQSREASHTHKKGKLQRDRSPTQPTTTPRKSATTSQNCK